MAIFSRPTVRPDAANVQMCNFEFVEWLVLVMWWLSRCGSRPWIGPEKGLDGWTYRTSGVIVKAEEDMDGVEWSNKQQQQPRAVHCPVVDSNELLLGWNVLSMARIHRILRSMRYIKVFVYLLLGMRKEICFRLDA